MIRDFTAEEERRLIEIARVANNSENWFDRNLIDGIERLGIETNILSWFLDANSLKTAVIDAYNISETEIRRIFGQVRSTDVAMGREARNTYVSQAENGVKLLKEIADCICIGNVDFYRRVAFFQKAHPNDNVGIKLHADHCPDFAKEVILPASYRTADGKIGHVAIWNDHEGGQLSCTYYTLRKLRERGLGFPFDHTGEIGDGNGGNWFNNSRTEYKRGGVNGIEELLDAYAAGESMENVVVSFSGPSPYGHVLLLDKVYKDENGVIWVEYSDMYPDIHDPNKSNPVKKKTIDAFKKDYKKYNGDIVGAVLVG